MSAAEARALSIYLHGGVAGTLEREPGARLSFRYTDEWVEQDGEPISLSLPTAEREFGHERCAPFFEGLLPEGDFLRAIARAFHVSAENPFAVLAEIGGECAGAIGVGAVGGPAPGSTAPPPRWLDDEQLAALLAELPERPLALLDPVEEGDGIRISLAGAHDKAGVLADPEGRIALSLGDPATTHILKLPIARVAEPIANEAYCMALARECGLDVAQAEARAAGPHEFLLVRRYDRERGFGPDGRLHQEDFCQALGVSPAEKYEGEGGPDAGACAALLWQFSAAPARDVPAFLDALLFNFMIGNNDAHGKNYSLLLDGPGSIRLAPLYDLLCTVAFGTRRKLAMRIGGENKPKYLRRRHLDRLAADLRLRPRLVLRRAEELLGRVAAQGSAARLGLPPSFRRQPVLDRIEAEIGERCDRLATACGEAAG